jgi:hypothetical protein
MKDLSTYLNDHLGGSVGALEMLEDMIDAQEGRPLQGFLKVLHENIESDQSELKRMMKELGMQESVIKKAGAWVAEKVSRAKLRVGDTGKPNLALLQSLEGLSLGIAGKRSLWRSLIAVKGSTARFGGFDLVRLEERASDQFKQVEGQVQQIAREIFSAELNERAVGKPS